VKPTKSAADQYIPLVQVPVELGLPPYRPSGGFRVGGRFRLRNGVVVRILAVDRPHAHFSIVWMSDAGDVDVCADSGAFTPQRKDGLSLQDIVGPVRGRPPKSGASTRLLDAKKPRRRKTAAPRKRRKAKRG
jgi:hypothetical protein